MNELPALHSAVLGMNLAEVRQLVKSGVDINMKDNANRTALHLFIYDNSDEEVQKKMLRFFLDRGASVIIPSGYNGISVAAEIINHGTLDLIKILLEYEIDLSAKENDDSTLLHHAASNKNPGVIELFQNKNVDFNARDHKSHTPMWNAVQGGNTNAIKFLLENGADDINYYAKHCFNDFLIFHCKKLEKVLANIELFLMYGADCETILGGKFMYSKSITLLDQAIKCDCLKLIEPMLAYLAKKEVVGQSIKQNILSKVNSHKKLNDYYNLCKKYIEKMKNINVYSFSLFDLINKTDQQLITFAKNQEVVEKLEKNITIEQLTDCYLMKHLRERIIKASRIAKLQENCTVGIAKLTLLGRNLDVINIIVEYLSEEDLINFCNSIGYQ